METPRKRLGMSETLYMFEDVFEASRNTIVFTFPDLFF